MSRVEGSATRYTVHVPTLHEALRLQFTPTRRFEVVELHVFIVVKRC